MKNLQNRAAETSPTLHGFRFTACWTLAAIAKAQPLLVLSHTTLNLRKKDTYANVRLGSGGGAGPKTLKPGPRILGRQAPPPKKAKFTKHNRIDSVTSRRIYVRRERASIALLLSMKVKILRMVLGGWRYESEWVIISIGYAPTITGTT